MHLLNVAAYYSPRFASVLGGILSKDEDWDFIKNGGDGALGGLNAKAKELGAGGYNLVRTIGIICLVICLLLVFLSFMVNKSAQETKENKKWLIMICIGGAGIFGVFSFVSIISSIGKGI